MKRAHLRNSCLKKKSVENNSHNYNRQRNYCISLLQMTKKYFISLNKKNLEDNMHFWKTIKPLLSDKIKSSNNIFLVEVDEIINENERHRTF